MTDPSPQITVAGALAHARKLLRFRPAAAARQALAIIAAEPNLAEAHLLLSYALRHSGRNEEADRVEQEGIRLAVEDPVASRARRLIDDGHHEQAEALLKLAVKDTPNDPEIIRLLGKIAARTGRHAHAEYSFRRSLRAAPSFQAAKDDLQALVAAHGSLSREIDQDSGEKQFAMAIQLNEEQLSRTPDDPWVWVSYGHVLRIAGRSEDALQAYRKAISLDPSFGDGWWSIADLKDKPFSDEDRTVMERSLASSLPEKQRAAIHFALGKAFQDVGDWNQSFAHYKAGNTLRSADTPFDPDRLDNIVDRMIDTFTKEFFETRAGHGAPESEPIFVISLPRSGSTLLEQMLASHSQIEATDELLELQQITNGLSGSLDGGEEIPDYVSNLAAMPPAKLRSIGMSYLINTLAERHQGKRHYLDKAPQNWLHVGLIHLILPNAKMIDIRRDPMSCGFSNFVQNYAYGRGFSYDLEKFGRYYRSYVRLMEHMDSVLPGRIHHVRYENLVREPAKELRGIFNYLQLPFEEAALRFYDSGRAVKTSSSEQVRRPLNERGIHTWKPYDQWLDPLRETLGDIAPAVIA